MQDWHKKIAAGASVALGITIAFGGFMLVQAIAPGAVQNPDFGPVNDDVVPEYNIKCNWTGVQEKRLACDGSSSSSGCVSMDVTCDAGVVTGMRSRYIGAFGGSLNCSTACGTAW